MSDRDFGRGQNGQMGWRNQANGSCGEPRSDDQFSQQPSYGSEVYGRTGEVSDHYGGFGAASSGQGISWQPGHPQGEFSGQSQFGGWETGYGPGGQLHQGFGGPAASSQSWRDQPETWRHGHGQEHWEHGQSGRGFWGQGHAAGSLQGPPSQGAWGSQFDQGVARQPEWQGSMNAPWQPGPRGAWGQDMTNRFDDPGNGSQLGVAAGLTPAVSWFAPGPYTGRGPRGYQRSDGRIEEDICERLTQHGQLDASDVQVMVAQGEVTLTGMVESRQAKRLAEDILDSIAGVKDIHNQLRVQQGRQAEPSQFAQETGGAKNGDRSSRNEKASAGVSRS